MPAKLLVNEGGLASKALETAILNACMLRHDVVPQDLICLVLLATEGTICGFIGAPTAGFTE